MKKLILFLSVILAVLISFSTTAVGTEYSGPIYQQGVNDVEVISDRAFCATSKGLEIIDISNPSAMTLVGEFTTAWGAAAVAVNKNFVYLAAWDVGLDIIDISNPRRPLLVDNFAVSSYACDVFLSDHYAYVANGYYGLRIIDISDPAKPLQMGVLDTRGFAFKVIVDGKYAFVHDLNNGVLIIDIENPANPTLKNVFNVDAGISDFSVADECLYIARRYDELLVVDCSDINNLRQIGSMTYSNISNLSIHEDYAIVAGGTSNSEIGIVSIISKSEPGLLSTLNTQTWNKKITIIGNIAFTAGCSGFNLIDISNPPNPLMVGSYYIEPAVLHLYGIDPYISMPGEIGPSTMDYNQDGRDFVLREQYAYVTGRAGETDQWHVFFLKADTSGAEDWSLDYGPWTLYDAAFAITSTNDNDFVLAGKVQPTQGRTNDDILIRKVDSDGDSIWHHQYDLDGLAYDGNGFDRLWDIVELDNGDLVGCGIITARDMPIDPLVLPESHKDAGLIKFDAFGEIYWVQYFGSTLSTETARACFATSDDSLVFAGYSGYHYDSKNQLYVVKTDMSGDISWERSHGNPEKWHNASWIREADDGNYIIAGEIETNRGIDGLVLKVSSGNGDIIWQRTFGEQYADVFLDGLITQSGEILLVGYKTIDTLDTRIPWLVKLDSNGSYICEINGDVLDTNKYFFSLRGPMGDKYVFGGNSLNPYDVFIANSDLSSCEALLLSYLPGDANMITGQWPPQIIGSDVTFLVSYFRQAVTPCSLDGFFCSGDANGDCQVIGSDITRLVNYFRGAADISYCPDHEPMWPTPDYLPGEAPSGWPNCE